MKFAKDIYMTIRQGMKHCYIHFINQETKAQKSKVAWIKNLAYGRKLRRKFVF